MARIRSIHPALFTDEAFASLSMAARVLLIGLWTEADDQGVFDWKPVTLKMRVMPVDNVSVPGLLAELEANNVVKSFDEDGRQFGAIRNFCKFQRPKTPKYRGIKSDEIRDYVASAYSVSETTGSKPDQFPQKAERTEPEPISFLQKEEKPPQRKEEGGRMKDEKKENTPPVAKATRPVSEKFEEFWKERPRRDGDDPRKPAEKKFNALVKTGVDPDVMISGARLATAAAKERGIYGTKFVPQTVKWLNDQRFVDYAAEAYSATDQSKPADEAFWDSILTSFKRFGYWSGQAGPGLDSPDCRVPDEMFAKHGLSRALSPPIEAPRLKSMGDFH